MTYKELILELERLKELGKEIDNMEVVFLHKKRFEYYPISDVVLRPVHHSELRKHIVLK